MQQVLAGNCSEHSCCVQANAEDAVRQMLVAFSEEQQLPEVGTVTAEDQMDDGTPIRVFSLSATTCRVYA